MTQYEDIGFKMISNKCDNIPGIYIFRGETPIAFESTLERDFLIRAEFFLDVLDVIPQPVQIPFVSISGMSLNYSPKFKVYYFLGDRSYQNYPKPLLVDIKSQKELKNNKKKCKPKWKAAIQYSENDGCEFRIYSEYQIRDQAYENICFLERYKRMRFPIEDSRWVIDNVRNMGNAPFHYILARHFGGIYVAEGIAHIWHLLATRQLDCDISRPLNDFTELWVPYQFIKGV